MGRKNGETFLDFRKRMLDPVSPSFCAAKWKNATIWLADGMTTSCHLPPAHMIDQGEILENPSAIHNTKHKKQMRALMLQGDRPDECEYCWKIEDIAKDTISDRVYKSIIYDDKVIEEVARLDPNENVTPKTLEIAFDGTCNFACSYCSPTFSTTWTKDIKKNGRYNDLISDSKDNLNIPEHQYKDDENNPYIEAFWKWWYSDLQYELEEIRITGGEPLMAKSVWKLFEWFKNNPEKGKKIRYAINSNLVPKKQETLEKLIEYSHYVPKLEIYTSNESHREQSEYIRDGMKYDQWLSNIRNLIENGNINGLHMMMTINSLCLDSITEFMDDMLDLKREFGVCYPTMTLNILRFPSFQSIAVLPDHIKKRLREKLQTWYLSQLEKKEKDKDGKNLLTSMEKAHIERIINYLEDVNSPHSKSSSLEELYHDFRSFYKQYDKRRGKDFRKTFSKDLVDFLDNKT